jgi:predicted restriction endonuclease
MNYFWVNQKQTYKQEREGGYLWAPKRGSDGKQHWGWKTMTKVNQGDIIFNNVNGALRSYCVATSAAYDFSKPAELEQEWEQQGWKINVRYIDLQSPIVISEHLNEIGDLFPTKYSPYSVQYKKANQSYLAELSIELGTAIAKIGGVNQSTNNPNQPATKVITSTSSEPKDAVKDAESNDFVPTATEKEMLVKQRLTQGRFRKDLMDRYNERCAVTGLDVPSLLVASHIKPWSESTAKEQNDVDNGFLLVAHLDKLFDQHLISFNVKGEIIISNTISHRQRSLLGLTTTMKIGNLTTGNQRYLNHHRKQLKK